MIMCDRPTMKYIDFVWNISFHCIFCFVFFSLVGCHWIVNVIFLGMRMNRRHFFIVIKIFHSDLVSYSRMIEEMIRFEEFHLTHSLILKRHHWLHQTTKSLEIMKDDEEKKFHLSKWEHFFQCYCGNYVTRRLSLK